MEFWISKTFLDAAYCRDCTFRGHNPWRRSFTKTQVIVHVVQTDQNIVISIPYL